MGLIGFTNITALFLLHSCFYMVFCAAIDTITSAQFIRDPETITSNGSIFKLGFFSPNGLTNRYVGIWYNNKESASNVIWVANRDKPLKDSSGVLTISQGNLLVLNGQNDIVWSSNVSTTATNASAQLLDSGSLVLRAIHNSSTGDNTGKIIWESFEVPCDTFVAQMKLSTNIITGEKTVLTSWKSPLDPSIGDFSAGINPLNIPQYFIWNGSIPFWRSGPWNGQAFIGVPTMASLYLDGTRIQNDEEGTTYLTTVNANKSLISRFVLNSNGTMTNSFWDDGKEGWVVSWLNQESECDVYGKCGSFGICNLHNRPICSCLKGFMPKNIEEWRRGNWTNGCVRKTELQCERRISGRGKEDRFWKLRMVKVPDFVGWSSASEDNCETECLETCSCVAYAYSSGIGCMLWSGNLIDIQELSNGGEHLYIRIAHSELDDKQDMKVIIITVILVTIGMAICTCTWRWMAKQRAKGVLWSDLGDANQAKLQELPVFNFAMLATATNNFDFANKLGEGGFGPVYRGKLLDGQEIAVKRLSRGSGQGLEQFMNEVVISKLQHQNLVMLLGCCIEGEEKMLIYEYMPNKSLDIYLFDQLKRELLHWRKRFEIIKGIGRGLLYLHRDSRLRIIHRDLKASNVLLDEELNPKISDFGMARIFKSNQDQAKTSRVVGTYGYMSPEYAMAGSFSEKSDVFSFGVLILEIISGKRNTGFYNDEQSSSVLQLAWKMWNEGNILELVDPVISAPSFKLEILRCIHVGLLCVQEFAKDRPNVSTALSMLTSEIHDLPTPKQPAFTEREIGSYTESAPNNHKRSSINNVTITLLQGR